MFKNLLMIIFLFTTTLINAEDLGVIGKTYIISEPDMIDWIKSKATNLVKSGEWENIRQQEVKTLKNYFKNPTPVANITDTVENKSWYYKPMVQVPQDITDMNGHTIAKAGSYNPLKYKPFDMQLIFINGNNKNQIKWAIEKSKIMKTKIVLTQGAFIDLDKKYKLWFYYDQSGKYTQKLNIHHVPAIVEQDGLNLKISEIVINSPE